jgi:hypothetical protein
MRRSDFKCLQMRADEKRGSGENRVEIHGEKDEKGE